MAHTHLRRAGWASDSCQLRDVSPKSHPCPSPQLRNTPDSDDNRHWDEDDEQAWPGLLESSLAPLKRLTHLVRGGQRDCTALYSSAQICSSAALQLCVSAPALAFKGCGEGGPQRVCTLRLCSQVSPGQAEPAAAGTCRCSCALRVHHPHSLLALLPLWSTVANCPIAAPSQPTNAGAE